LERRRGRCDDACIEDARTREPVMKIATYGTMHFGVAFGVAWALTGDARLAGAIALVEPAVQTVAYALHERAWRDPAAIRRAASRALGRLRAVLVPPFAAMAAAEAR
jgi:uncharacterized membrane protein